MCPMFFTGMKWLKEKAIFREKTLGKLREDAYNNFSRTLERESYDCYITACMEFGTVTRKVRTPSYSFQLCSIILSNFILSLIPNAKAQSSKIQKSCVINYASQATRPVKTCHSSALRSLVETKALSH